MQLLDLVGDGCVVHVLALALLELRMCCFLAVAAAGLLLLVGSELAVRRRCGSGCILLVTLLGGGLLELASTHEQSLYARWLLRLLLLLLLLCRSCGEFESILCAERRRCSRADVKKRVACGCRGWCRCRCVGSGSTS